MGLRRPVPFASLEGVAADHSLDLPGSRVDGQESPFDDRVLVQRDFELLGLRVDLVDLDLDDVSALEKLFQIVGPGPADVLVLKPARVPLHFDYGLAPGSGQDDGIGDLVFLHVRRHPAVEPFLLELFFSFLEQVPLVLAPPFPLVHLSQPGEQRFLGIFLELRVESRVDFEAPAVEGFAAVFFLDVFPDFFEKIGGEIG